MPRSRASETRHAGSSVWRVYLVSGIIAILAYLLLPYPAVKALVFYPALAVSAAAAIVIGVWVHRSAHLLIWYLFAAGQFAFIVGDIMFSFYEYVLETAPFPSVADAFYLGGYLPIAAALLVLVRGRTPGGDRANFVDATLIAIGLGMLSWVFLMAPYARDPSLSLLERSVLITYPLVDVLLLAVLVRFMIAPGARTPAYYFLGLSLIVLLISDVSYGIAELAGTFQSGGLIDAGYLLSYVLWGTAALHPSMSRLSEPVSDSEVKPSRKRLVLLAGVSLMAPALLAIQAARGEPFDMPVIVGGSVALFSLVLVRMEGLLHALTTTLGKHKQAERRLREAETRYRTLVEQVPVVVYSGRLDEVSSAKYVSPQIEALLGFTPDEWLAEGDLWDKLLHPEDRERVLAEANRTAITDEPFETEYRLLTRDGQTVWIRDEAVMVRDEEGRHRHWRGIMSDISERKRAEEALRVSETRLRTVIEQSPLAIHIFAPDGLSLLSNSAWKEVWHPGEEEGPEGTNIFEDDQLRTAGLTPYIEESIAGGVAVTTPPLLYRRAGNDTKGEGLWLRACIYPVQDEAGRMLEVAFMLEDVTEHKLLEDELSHRAFHDPLTDLPNRDLFRDRLRHALSRTRRREKKIAVLFMDLDNFKYVNDSLGHEEGDRLLVAVSERLTACLRPEDTLARLGGDEFIVLLEDIAEEGEAINIAERIAQALQHPIVLNGHEIYATTSIGIALGCSGEDRADDLLQDADAAMYQAKRKGKSRYETFRPEMKQRSSRRLRLEGDFRRALEREEFRVFYQPKVLIETGEIVGMEASVRWEHPEQGLLPPSRFVPLAEETGLIMPLGRWVLREACRQAKEWHERYPADPPLMMGVNLSTRQFQHPRLVEDVAGILKETGLDASSLILEITESATIEDAPSALATLVELKALGVRFAIDDFGTGYSSLSYLKRFPVDFLKIDRSIVEGVDKDPSNAAIVSAAATLAHALGLKVVAEGVERGEELKELRILGCDMGQGYYWWGPLPARAMTALVANLSL